MGKSVRITSTANGLFALEIITMLQPERTQLLNLPDHVERIEGLTFDELTARLRAVFA